MNKKTVQFNFKRKVLFLCFLFSFLIGSNHVFAQKETALTKKETQKEEEEKNPKEKIRISGIRFGTDVIQLGVSAFKPDYSFYKGYADVMLNNSYFIVTEFGGSNITRTGITNEFRSGEARFSYNSKGSFMVLGIDANALNKKSDDDAIIFGLRYGKANFSHSVVYASTDSFYGDFTRTQSADNLSVSWFGLATGFKLHFLENFYLSSTIEVKIKLSESDVTGLAISEIPNFGVNKATRASISYHLLYRIPFKNKRK